jgi:hypothetical protein
MFRCTPLESSTSGTGGTSTCVCVAAGIHFNHVSFILITGCLQDRPCTLSYSAEMCGGIVGACTGKCYCPS